METQILNEAGNLFSLQQSTISGSAFKLFDEVIVSGSATGYGDTPGYVTEINWNNIAEEYFCLIIGSGVYGGGKRFYVQERFLKRQQHCH